MAVYEDMNPPPGRSGDRTARRRVYQALFEDRTLLGKLVDVGLALLIVANVAVVVAESVDEVAASWAREFQLFEAFSVVVFTVEYVLRLWSVVESPRYADPVRGRLRYAVSFGAVVDLIAILPFFLPHLLPMDTRFVRALRLLRLLRMLKLGRQSKSLDLYARVFRAKRPDLIMTLAVLAVMLVVASSVMYFLETDAQPEGFGNIPRALWWGVVTMTTIGYGDVYPVTALGRIIGGVVALFGVAFFALPPAILVAGVMEELQKQHDREQAAARDERCPHCGLPLTRPEGG